MPDRVPRPSRDLRAHRRQTQRGLMVGFILILLIVGGGLIAWRYGLGGLLGGLACMLVLIALVGLLWLILTWAGRWAERDE